MQAYIKDNKLIVNTMIQQDEEDDLYSYIDKVKKYGVIPEVLYNTSGEISGIAFKTKKGE